VGESVATLALGFRFKAKGFRVCVLLLHTKIGNFFQITIRKIKTNKQRTSYNSSSSSSLYKTNSVHKKKLCYFFSKLPPPREHHLHNINKAKPDKTTKRKSAKNESRLLYPIEDCH
jgi:hypothetical protein